MRAREGTAKRYAKAFYLIAAESGSAEAFGRELDAVCEIYTARSDLRNALSRPWVEAAARRGIALAIARKAGTSKLIQDFVALVAARGRMDHFPEIATAYRNRVDQALGRVRAQVGAAVTLTEEERRQLTRRLEGALGKRIVLEETVDPNLLGGFLAQVGSLIVDGSLNGQLARMRERLVRG